MIIDKCVNDAKIRLNTCGGVKMPIRTKPSNIQDNTKRVAGRVTPEVDLQIDEWATKLGMTKTSFISLCIRAGLTTVIRTIQPESLLTEADWQKILLAGQNAGVKSELEEMQGVK